MKKFIAAAGLLGTGLLVAFNIIDHIMRRGMDSNLYYILLMISLLLMLPMLIREALVLKDDVENKKNDK